MEIPLEIKDLYKHWEYHTKERNSSPFSDAINKDIYNDILLFINERMRIYERKAKGEIKPYTKDKILSDYRFCNIYRELDKQTIQIHTANKRLLNDINLWILNTAFARFLCNYDTYSKVGKLSFDRKENEIVYDKLIQLPSPKYGSAYIFPISIIQNAECNTREKFFCFYLSSKIKEVVNVIKKYKRASVVEILQEILPVFGYNFRFHFTEILIDIAYQFPQYIDLYKDFPIGPGSLPTMKKLSQKDTAQTINNLVSYIPKDFEYLTIEGKKVFLSAENWEGIGCEYRKYSNLKNGSGRKRKYK